MADSYERALWAVEDTRRELGEAEMSGDHEAVLIWERALREALDNAADLFPQWDFGGNGSDYESERHYL